MIILFKRCQNLKLKKRRLSKPSPTRGNPMTLRCPLRTQASGLEFWRSFDNQIQLVITVDWRKDWIRH
uniref:Uncharacterized protein n=1 Tax=Helianthus annuus TaxID=4232 RepID=A0A251S772_HELAN